MRTFRRVVSVLLLCGLVATACGDDREEDAADDGDDRTTTTAAGGDGDAMWGDLPSPCGEGDASGATDLGVTDDAITIGYGDDAGFPGSPGLNHEMGDAVKAMIAWCNEQGGINGREVRGNYYDAKITDVNNAVTQACEDEVFMLVGEGYGLDSVQEPIRLGCELPAFPAFSVSPQFANGPLMIAALPNPVDYQLIGHANWYAKTYPQKAKKLAFMYANYAATQDTAMKSKSTWPKVGMVDIECDQVYNITGEADWKPFIQKLKDCGAEVIDFIGSPYPAFQNVLEAADQLDYDPDWLVESNHYDKQFARWNTRGYGDNVYVRMQDVPFEYAADSPATQKYLDVVEASGGDASGLGAHAASAFLLWATQVKACGSEVTRACVLENASKVHKWTGGGMSGGSDAGRNMPLTCELIVSMNGPKWEQVYPEEPGTFHCDPDNVQKVEGEVVDKVKLGPDRVVTDFSR